jgi:hypothetical protein
MWIFGFFRFLPKKANKRNALQLIALLMSVDSATDLESGHPAR